MIKGKDDINGAMKLKALSKLEIIENADTLLEFLQDINWPVSGPIAEVLSIYTNDLESKIIKILEGCDEEWKYSVTLLLLYNSKVKPSNKLLSLLDKKVKKPSSSEMLNEFSSECQDVLNKWRKI